MQGERTGLALSIRQPWAWLIVRPDVTRPADRADLVNNDRMKLVENRTWSTKVRGVIGIHAGKKIDAEGYNWVRDNFPEIPLPTRFEVGGIVGRATLVDCVFEAPWTRWFFGPFGFVFRETEPLPFMPCRGGLGFFRPAPPRLGADALEPGVEKGAGPAAIGSIETGGVRF